MWSEKFPTLSHGDTLARTSRVNPRSQKLNAASNFADDVLTEILCRLRVKSLLRLRSVSKYWCSRIDSQHFVKAHLNKSIECRTHSSILSGLSGFYSLDFDSLDYANPIKLDDPTTAPPRGSSVVGSCNGLGFLYKSNGNICMCNPAIRKFRNLPSPPTDFNFGMFPLLGIGYDSRTDDYKVVSIDESYGDGFMHFKIIVYGLKTNIWRWVQNVPPLQMYASREVQNIPTHVRFRGTRGIFSDGALHWIIVQIVDSERSFPSIVAFDLEVENYREIVMPKFQNKQGPCNVSLAVFEELLCILDNYARLRTDVWVMNIYGVENSRTKLFSVEHLEVIRYFSIHLFKEWRGCSSRRGRAKGYVVYNLESKKARHATVYGFTEVFMSEVYSESLVPLCESIKNQFQTTREEETDIRNSVSCVSYLII